MGKLGLVGSEAKLFVNFELDIPGKLQPQIEAPTRTRNQP